MNTHVFLITAMTNLHVGNEGGSDFSIIDKAIQRDPLTLLPCINSSSLKGAINEYCSMSPNSKMKDNDNLRKKIFGSDKRGENTGSQKGEAIFFDAKILFMPEQINDDKSPDPFVLRTSKKVVDMMNERVNLFCPNSTKFEFPVKDDMCVDYKKFKSMCNDDNLPIIARNVLDNGESKNLWYEQILPPKTVLYTIIRENGTVLAKELQQSIVQIGAGATIGYGYCLFELLKTINETKED